MNSKKFIESLQGEVRYNQIRIGNILEYWKRKEMCKVSGILKGGLYIEKWAAGCLSMYQFKGVAVTPEILTGLGFKYVQEAQGYANNKHFIYEAHKELGCWLFCPFCTNDEDCAIKFKNLHELQNIIFMIDGEELKVRNGKAIKVNYEKHLN
jgi:hypothetical protein